MNNGNIVFLDGRWSFIVNGVGWRGFGFELNGVSLRNHQVAVADHGLDAVGEGEGWREEIQFRRTAVPSGLTVKRTIVNVGQVPLAIRSAGDGMLDEEAEILLAERHEYTVCHVHSANSRTEKYPDSRPEYPYLRPVPYAPATLGLDEANHLPVLMIGDGQFRTLLVEGELDQSRFVRVWQLGLDGPGGKDKVIRTCRAEQVYPMSSGFVLAPGARVELAHVFYQVLADVHPQDAFAGYRDTLTALHQFQGPLSPMLHGAVFCTWNYGTLHEINEALILERATALKRRVPECTHFLIDDGYQAQRGRRNGPLDTFYPDLDCDRERFPRGMKFVADELKSRGLTPCIWLSPAVYLDSLLAAEHPEWLLADATGDLALLGKSTFLDPSVPEAWSFLLQVFDRLFCDWGYRGVKLDFMTHWFTLAKARFRHGGSGPEWRDRVFAEIRRRIGPDGLFMTCIAMSMGNPFPGGHADCYRCGCDIHDGTWPEQLRACRATLPQLIQEGRRTFLLNMDSAGFGNIPENEQFFRLTWVFITQGIIELGGQVEDLPEKQILRWRHMLRHLDRGHRVRCLDDRAFTGDGLPEALAVAYPPDSSMARAGIIGHLALFNWTDETRLVAVARSRLEAAGNVIAKDFWRDQEEPWDGDLVQSCLPPRSAKLYEMSLPQPG